MIFQIEKHEVTVSTKCPCCESEQAHAISSCSTSNGLVFLSTAICGHCGHVYRDRVPSEKWFDNAFRLRHAEQQKRGFNPMNPEIEQQRYDRYRAIGDFLRKTLDEGHSKLLDVGCGPGTGLDAFRDLGFSIVGVDPDESRAKVAVEKGHEIHIGEFKTYDTSQKFDIITLIHSLEHFQNPELFLRQALAYAHENTVFYLEVPEVLDHVLDWNDSLYLAHISNFNPASLENLANRCGWELISRVYPYAGTGLHEGHLAMTFRPVRGSAKSAMQQVDQGTIETIKSRYVVGIDDVIGNKTVHFKVKEINDISLCYKGISELKKDVHDNYANRALTRQGENVYFVH